MSRTTPDLNSSMDGKQPGHSPRPTSAPTITADSVRNLAEAAGLSLAPDRAAVLLPILRLWLTDSAALNTVMQNGAYREVLPITLFKHPRSDAGAA